MSDREVTDAEIDAMEAQAKAEYEALYQLWAANKKVDIDKPTEREFLDRWRREQVAF
jgi:hypothetical protein